jgi:CubicO group peptidase (beta-lactamase class C family)
MRPLETRIVILKLTTAAFALALTVAVGAASAVRAADGSALTPAQVAAIDAIGQRSIDAKGAPSVEIAVVQNGAIVYQKGFGLRNVEDAVPPDAQTRYPIGSNTKQFTAAAILLLQDEGKLSVDDRLAKYLPEIPHAREVTLRNLLMHTGGYAEFTEIETFDELGARPATPLQVVSSVVKRPLGFKPGTKRQYSNTGFMLLQMVVERVGGMPYADFLQRRVFTPLGMTSTYVRDFDDTQPDVATEYANFALGPWEHALHLDYTWFGGAGAIVSNAGDLAKWNAALDGGKLLSPRSLAQMMTPVKIDDNFPDYGFAISNGKLPNGHHMISHGGNTTGAATQDARFPDDHLAIIVLSNGGHYGYNAAVSAIYSILVPSSPSPSASPSPKASPKPPKLPAGANASGVSAAKAWLDAAIDGHVDLAKLRPDFRAHMNREHLAALRALAAYGKRTYTVAGYDRRAPTSSYVFLITAGSRQITYLYSLDDDGSVAGIALVPRITFGAAGVPSQPPALATPAP